MFGNMRRAPFFLLALLMVVGVATLLFIFRDRIAFTASQAPTQGAPSVAASTASPVTLTPQQLGTATKRDVPPGKKEYRSERFHFSLFYPEDLQVVEDSKADTLTVAFQNTNKDDAKGFQIFVQAYTLPQVTPERFKKDVPSGVRKNAVPVTVGGATGAAFESADAELGDTLEVWFIHQGLLYEVTSPKLLEGWLDPILTTWQFINQ